MDFHVNSPAPFLQSIDKEGYHEIFLDLKSFGKYGIIRSIKTTYFPKKFKKINFVKQLDRFEENSVVLQEKNNSNSRHLYFTKRRLKIPPQNGNNKYDLFWSVLNQKFNRNPHIGQLGNAHKKVCSTR